MASTGWKRISLKSSMRRKRLTLTWRLPLNVLSWPMMRTYVLILFSEIGRASDG